MGGLRAMAHAGHGCHDIKRALVLTIQGKVQYISYIRTGIEGGDEMRAICGKPRSYALVFDGSVPSTALARR